MPNTSDRGCAPVQNLEGTISQCFEQSRVNLSVFLAFGQKSLQLSHGKSEAFGFWPPPAVLNYKIHYIYFRPGQYKCFGIIFQGHIPQPLDA